MIQQVMMESGCQYQSIIRKYLCEQKLKSQSIVTKDKKIIYEKQVHNEVDNQEILKLCLTELSNVILGIWKESNFLKGGLLVQ